MKRYDVKLSEGALSRLDALYDYIAYKLEAPETAQAQTERIEDAILTLETLPERCRYSFLGMVMNYGVLW